MVINYHLIGDSAMAKLDPSVFSTDSNGLDDQIMALRRRFTVASQSKSLYSTKRHYILSSAQARTLWRII
jgi:hypothetical protein